MEEPSTPTSPSVDYASITDFYHQVAGHTNEKVRRYRDKYILKPQNKVDLFRREVNFYEDIFSQRVCQHQTRFLAKYHGVVDVETERLDSSEEDYSPSKGGLPHLILDDMTIGYNRPCMVDIKMGRQTFEPTASKEKKEREIKKYCFQSEIGFRITGLKVWDDQAQAYHYLDKKFGRSVQPDQVLGALAFYFFDGTTFRVDVMKSLVTRLKDMLTWMKCQNRYKFFCSSILIVYDGNHVQVVDSVSERDAEQSKSGKALETCRASMIDFAHVVPNKDNVQEVDEGYVYGLESLISKISTIVDMVTHEDPQEVAAFVDAMSNIIFPHPK